MTQRTPGMHKGDTERHWYYTKDGVTTSLCRHRFFVGGFNVDGKGIKTGPYDDPFCEECHKLYQEDQYAIPALN